MSAQEYPAYKSSGVEWLGEIPGHWDTRRVRWLCKIKKRIAGELGHDVLSITQQGIKVKDLESNDGQLSMDYSKYQLVEVGDFAMNHMDLLTGYVDISDKAGVTSPDYRVFSIRNTRECFDRYLLYLFQMGYRNKIFYAYGQGSSQLGRWRLPTEQFNDLTFPLPPKVEQEAIVAFLDREVAKIDELIQKQQKLVGLLQEKGLALISDVLIRGLSKGVALKDSGCAWLGKVPKHWDVKRMRFAVEINPSKSEVASLARDTPVTFLPMECIGDDGTISLEIERPIGEVETGYTYFRNGDVTIAKITPCFENGKGALMDGLRNEVGFGTTELIVTRSRPGIIAAYLHYTYISPLFRKLGESQMYGAGGQKRVPDSFVRDYIVAVPPVHEQEEIVLYLDREFERHRNLIRTAQRAVTLLEERRTALVSAAVTGKLDIRPALLNRSVA